MGVELGHHQKMGLSRRSVAPASVAIVAPNLRSPLALHCGSPTGFCPLHHYKAAVAPHPALTAPRVGACFRVRHPVGLKTRRKALCEVIGGLPALGSAACADPAN